MHGLVVAAWVTLAGCSDGAGPGAGSGHARLGLRVVAGAGVSDTIDARLPGALVVELRDSAGRVLPGQPLRFAAPGVTAAGGARVEPAASAWYSAAALDTTDAAGRASVRVRFGVHAGPAVVRIESLDGAWRAEAPFTVLPGAPASLAVSPTDTAVYAGRAFQLRATVRDRGGNPRDGAVNYAALEPAARVSGAGAVEALAIGRGAIRATVGPLADTAYVSVPPVGTIAASAAYGSSSDRIRSRVYTVNLDGSGRQAVATSEFWAEPPPAWSPDGASLVFPLGDHDTRLYAAGGGGTRRLIATPSLPSEGYPRYSRDGAWIYFNGRPGHQNCALWRVRPDGTGAEQVGLPVDDYQIDANPDPSPDGARVVFNTNRVSPTMPVIRVLDLAGRTVAPIDVPGVTPRWSPDGTRIAYVPTGPSWGYLDDNRAMRSAGPLTLMRTDGTGREVIPTGAALFAPGFDWSPDGKYIIARSSAGVLAVVVIATGETLPLAFAADLELPAWKP